MPHKKKPAGPKKGWDHSRPDDGFASEPRHHDNDTADAPDRPM